MISGALKREVLPVATEISRAFHLNKETAVLDFERQFIVLSFQ
jgi:hypothetical protein